MAEMEKEGRPPENKRSRKPAHPVKREINEEMKVGTERAHPWAGQAGDLHGNPPYSMSFAENTMNELLGWYGYDKVELRDSDSLDMRGYPEGDGPQHISVLRENSLPKVPASMENNNVSPNQANSSQATPTSQATPPSRNGLTEPSTSMSSAQDHGNMALMVPMVPPPLIKPPADEDMSNIQIMCAWCQKVGVKRYSLSMGSELKNFCSEKCFAACRRAYFKRNKARDEDGLGEKLPQHSYAKDTAMLVFKTNSDVLVCDWCKHIRHTKEYLDFGAGERRLQFCSAKCLNQYKMDIFYKETQAALPGGFCNPGHNLADSKAESSAGVQLLTPESWGTPLTDLRRKAPSPGVATTSSVLAPSSAASPSESGTVCSPSSSAKNPTPRPHESPTLPPPPVPTLHPPMGVPPGSPPMVMTPRGPVPLPLFMEHQMMQQMRPPFLRPPHATGPNSPLSNPMIPGIGPPPPMPPRTLCPPSSSMHRPLLSPHMHPSSTPSMPGLPSHPGLHMPGLPPFPPVNMMPNGHIPMPHMMNFGMPSFAPLVPPPTLLVPYPVIVPLPVPIPIPVPIPFHPKTSGHHRDSHQPIPSAAEESAEPPDPHAFSPSSSGGDRDRQGGSSSSGGALSPGFSSYTPGHLGSERSRADLVDRTVKAEESSGGSPSSGLSLSGAPSLTEGVIDLTLGGRSRGQQVIQRVMPTVQVKVEPELDSSPSPSGPASPDGPGLRRSGSPRGIMGKEGAREAAGSPLDSTPLPGDAASLRSADPSLPQPSPYPAPHPPPGSTPRNEPGPAAPCNVIVNGAGRSALLAPPSEQGLDHRAGGGGGEGEHGLERRGGGGGGGGEEEPASVELEREALKENSCSVAEWDAGKRAPSEEVGGPGEGKPDPDANLEDEEHAYALPLLSKAGSVVIQPVPKPCSDKTAILSCGINAPLAAAGSPELEPPLKRRCLRIRNQNK